MPCVTGGGKTHNVAQIAQLWIDNGGAKEWAVPMALVAWAESGGQSGCVNQIKATGLWQIYNGPNTNTHALQDPDTNAKAAIAKFKAGHLAPWVSSKGAWGKWFDASNQKVTTDGWSAIQDSGVKSGENFLDSLKALNPFDSERGLSLSTPDLIKNPIEGLIQPVKDIANTVVAIGDFIVHPRRLLKLVIGGVLLMWGLSTLSKSLGGPHPARAVSRAARGTAPVGAVTKTGDIAKGAGASTKTAMKQAVKTAVVAPK
jgi:hypothetical protein